mgnify:CR=1 FL=1
MAVGTVGQQGSKAWGSRAVSSHELGSGEVVSSGLRPTWILTSHFSSLLRLPPWKMKSLMCFTVRL